MSNYYPHIMARVYGPDVELTKREACNVIGVRSPLIVDKWLLSGKLKSLRSSDVMEWKGRWEKERAERKGQPIEDAVPLGRPKKAGTGLTSKVVSRIMELAMELEDGYGVELFKKRMAVIYNTTAEEVGKILGSRVFVRRRVIDDMQLSGSDAGVIILKILKRLLLNPNTKDKTKLVETINEILKQTGSGKKWKLREVGDKVDEKLKTYEIENK